MSPNEYFIIIDFLKVTLKIFVN